MAPMTLSAPARDATTSGRTEQQARSAYLRAAVRVAGRASSLAGLLAALDAVPAAGVALGLALGIAAMHGGLGAMAPWLALAAAAASLRAALAWLAARQAARASVAVRAALRRRALAACLGLPPGARRPVGELMVGAIDAAEALDGYVARFLPARLAASLAPLLLLPAVAVASPISAAILAGTLVPFVVLMILAGSAAAARAREQLASLARLGGIFADRVRHLPLILAFQAEGTEAARLARAAEALHRRTMGVLRLAFVSSSGLDFFAALSIALVAVYCGFNLLGLLPFPVPEHLDLARAFFVLLLAPEIYAPLRRLAAAYHDRQLAEAAADQLRSIEQQAALPPPALPPLASAPVIRFDAVGARYPDQDRPVLDDLSFSVRPGEIVALMGASGSGKTTALNLLLGLAPLASGEIWVGDVALSQVGSVAPWVAWVGQSPLLVPGTLAENLALSRPAATREQVAAAGSAAGLGPLLERRQAGLDARIDERGGGLSGGERRRIAFARALLKQAPILLLDEPTAHLDPDSEAELAEAIRRAARGRTTLLATHSARLAAIADRVVRLTEG